MGTPVLFGLFGWHRKDPWGDSAGDPRYRVGRLRCDLTETTETKNLNKLVGSGCAPNDPRFGGTAAIRPA